jgi:hypothetical protein
MGRGKCFLEIGARQQGKNEALAWLENVDTPMTGRAARTTVHLHESFVAV